MAARVCIFLARMVSWVACAYLVCVVEICMFMCFAMAFVNVGGGRYGLVERQGYATPHSSDIGRGRHGLVERQGYATPHSSDIPQSGSSILLCTHCQICRRRSVTHAQTASVHNDFFKTKRTIKTAHTVADTSMLEGRSGFIHGPCVCLAHQGPTQHTPYSTPHITPTLHACVNQRPCPTNVIALTAHSGSAAAGTHQANFLNFLGGDVDKALATGSTLFPFAPPPPAFTLGRGRVRL